MNLFDVQMYGFRGDVFVDTSTFSQLSGRSVRNIYNYLRGSVGFRNMISYRLPSGNLMIPVRELWEYPIAGRGRTFVLVSTIIDTDEEGKLFNTPVTVSTYSEANVARREEILQRIYQNAVQISSFIGEDAVTQRNPTMERVQKPRHNLPTAESAPYRTATPYTSAATIPAEVHQKPVPLVPPAPRVSAEVEALKDSFVADALADDVIDEAMADAFETLVDGDDL
jgi:hypothetical protein